MVASLRKMEVVLKKTACVLMFLLFCSVFAGREDHTTDMICKSYLYSCVAMADMLPFEDDTNEAIEQCLKHYYECQRKWFPNRP